ncbi:hypothetical protein PLICRDRAFT_55849 [Plicaturopsis crispa FD-325 SS-3]|nr:hypothetical protein PLICRDRAFT_55849 [Plicaturopsis crispa FD-325 SS-3]
MTSQITARLSQSLSTLSSTFFLLLNTPLVDPESDASESQTPSKDDVPLTDLPPRRTSDFLNQRSAPESAQEVDSSDASTLRSSMDASSDSQESNEWSQQPTLSPYSASESAVLAVSSSS